MKRLQLIDPTGNMVETIPVTPDNSSYLDDLYFNLVEGRGYKFKVPGAKECLTGEAALKYIDDALVPEMTAQIEGELEQGTALEF